MATPVWQVNSDGAFASVRITLPPGASCHCESDAVVTMSETIDVEGQMSGGILGSLARAFLTRESFFTTKIQNSSSTTPGDALIAPSDPGGVVLHRLAAPGEALILTSGAYLGGDDTVHVASEARNPFSGMSNFSGAGMFLLRASGRGNLAISAYGSIIKYTLRAGERRSVDNGHLVAWSSGMRTQMKLASRRAGIFGSMTSGEGLHVDFEGPGVLYVQSHKPTIREGNGSNRNGGAPSGGIGHLILFVFFLIIFLGMIFALIYISEGGFMDNGRGGSYQSNSNYGRRQRSISYGNNGYGHNEYGL